jgi:hypothetical protein
MRIAPVHIGVVLVLAVAALLMIHLRNAGGIF